MEHILSIGLILFSFVFGLTSSSASLTKKESAYDGLVVALHDSIPEDSDYLDHIKDLIQSSSEFMYNATDGAAYFHKVTIAVPNTWNNTANVSKIYENYYPFSHIRIVPPKAGASQIAAPFTMQPGGCGEAGLYIEVNTDFLTAESSSMHKIYGPKEKMLIHEWAHYRYGVFDEYGIPGDDQFPLFYFNNGFMEVAACPSDIRGWIRSTTTEDICEVFEDKVSSDCYFIPDEKNQDVEASIMSIPKLDQVEHFCDNSRTGNRSHNWRAPTKQNILCQQNSAWEVISSHDDFAKMSRKSEFKPTEFSVVRLEELEPRYVLVLDVSGSMVGRPMEIMKQACSYFVQDLIPDESYLGIVKFHSIALSVYPVHIVKNETRDALSKAIQSLKPTGNTAIGAGLKLSIQELQRANLRTEGAKIILLTDGAENTSPYIDQTLPLLLNASVRVDTIALGSKASLKLEALAEATKGNSYFFPNLEGDSIGQLKQILLSSITVHGNLDVDLHELRSSQHTLTTNGSLSISVIVDKELGKNTVFSVSSKNIGNVIFTLTSPDRTQYDSNDTEYYHEDLKQSLTASYKFEMAQAGVWNVSLRAKNTTSKIVVDLSVLSEAKDADQKPIKASSWISANTLRYPEVPKIFAQVTKGDDAVIRAKVIAIVTYDQTGKKIQLKDDGKGADVSADDGLYSGYFTDFYYGAKRYTVIAEVENAGEALVKQNRRRTLYAAPSRSSDKNDERRGDPSNVFGMDRFRKVNVDPNPDKPVGERADDFTRTSNAGSFQIDGLSQFTRDQIKPSPVMDLSVLKTSKVRISYVDRLTVTLQWTAPGDNMDKGKVETLELRGGNTSLTLESFFNFGYLFGNDDIWEGSLDPLEGGTIQNVTVLLPPELELKNSGTFDVLFSIRGKDKARNIGNTGNIASAHFGYQIKQKGDDSDNNNGNDGLTGVQIVGIILGVIVLIAAVVGIAFFIKRCV